MDISKKLILLALLKKEEDENLHTILQKLVASGSFDFKEAKSACKDLKRDLLINKEDTLTFTGVAKAQEIESEFKI